MRQLDIQACLALLDKCRSVAVDQITEFEHINLARKFCPSLRDGALSEVTDSEIWDALNAMRNRK
jgi:hypothetical protein